MSENPGGQPPRDDEPATPPTPPPPPPGGAYPPGPTPPAGPPPQPTPPPGAGYPPPAGGYPPPGPGYPPATPYGAAAPGYGAPVQGPTVGEAFNWGWTKFQQNLGTILLAMLLWIVGVTVVVGVWYGLLVGLGLLAGGTTTYDDLGNPQMGPGAGIAGAGFIVSFILIGAVGFLAAFLFQAGVIRGALHVTYGRPLELKTFFAFDHIGTVILTSLLLGVASSVVGGLTCGIGSIVVSFFGMFALHFVLDKQLGAWDAVKASVQLVNKNVATVVVLLLAVYVANLIGSALCGIGIFVSVPVGVLATTYTYRRLLGEPVAQ